jgi:hypothetical protein
MVLIDVTTWVRVVARVSTSRCPIAEEDADEGDQYAYGENEDHKRLH